jgi:hypothetical protein
MKLVTWALSGALESLAIALYFAGFRVGT